MDGQHTGSAHHTGRKSASYLRWHSHVIATTLDRLVGKFSRRLGISLGTTLVCSSLSICSLYTYRDISFACFQYCLTDQIKVVQNPIAMVYR